MVSPKRFLDTEINFHFNALTVQTNAMASKVRFHPGHPYNSTVQLTELTLLSEVQ